MRFPLEWLREFVEISLPPADLADRLSNVGLVVDAVEGEGDGAVLEIDVPANRPDCMNIYGMAREIAAFTGAALRPYHSDAAEAAGQPPSSASAAVEIQERALCGRYAGRVVRGIRVAASPERIASRLRAAGLNVVSNIVDVTNYVLHEIGHPLHAFDLAKVSGSRIVVRRARKGETLTTLDGVARLLDPDMLVISDAERPSALAGVMGGADSMISTEVRDVLLEAAHFDPASVRRTARKLGLSTDASFHFERCADIEAVQPAIDRAAALLAEVAGGQVAPGILDVRAQPHSRPRPIHVRLARAETLIGTGVEADRAAAGLEALGFGVQRATDGFDVSVPSHRRDVAEEVDLIEEIARWVGYETIPERLPELPGIGEIRRFAHRREDALRDSLIGSGFTEVLTLVYVSRDHTEMLREPGVSALPLTNAMAEGQDVLRSSLFPGLVQAVRHNLNRGVRDLRVFEVGHVFRKADRGGEPPAGSRDDRIADEPLMAGLAATGLARPRHWAEPARAAGFYDLKGALMEALSVLRIPAEFRRLEGEHPFEPGTAGEVLSLGRPVGRLGLLSPEMAGRLGIKTEVFLAEINLTRLFEAPPDPPILRPLPRYPASSRDLALVVRRGITWADIESAIREAGGDLVSSVALFDRYTGGPLPRDHVSLAVNIIYQRGDRTLAAEEIQAAEANLLKRLNERFGITLRQ